MNQRWTATQRFQSSSAHTFTKESVDCHTCREHRQHPTTAETEAVQISAA